MIKKVIRFVRRKKRILFPRQLYMGNKIRQEFLQPINFPIFYKKKCRKTKFLLDNKRNIHYKPFQQSMLG